VAVFVPGSLLEQLLTSSELAELLRVSERTIEGWAYRGTGPRVTYVGRHRRYRREDVREYLNARASGR
jgi:excisionase family DNA binding protein